MDPEERNNENNKSRTKTCFTTKIRQMLKRIIVKFVKRPGEISPI